MKCKNCGAKFMMYLFSIVGNKKSISAVNNNVMCAALNRGKVSQCCRSFSLGNTVDT